MEELNNPAILNQIIGTLYAECLLWKSKYTDMQRKFFELQSEVNKSKDNPYPVADEFKKKEKNKNSFK